MNYEAYAPGDGGAGGVAGAAGAMPSLTDFQSKDVVGGAQSFLDSNSYVAKAAFLILVVIVFVYVLRACITVIAYLFSPNSSPYLVDGVIDGNVGNLIIPQDPSETTAVPCATTAAEPPLDPPGTRSNATGFRTGPNAEFSFDDPIANSSQLALPMITPPAASSRSIAVASYGGT